MFELSEDSRDKNGNEDTCTSHTRPKQAPQSNSNKLSGRKLGMAAVAVIAILVLGGIVAIVIFKPSTSESNNEIEPLKQQLEMLRHLWDQQWNKTHHNNMQQDNTLQSQLSMTIETVHEYGIRVKKHKTNACSKYQLSAGIINGE